MILSPKTSQSLSTVPDLFLILAIKAVAYSGCGQGRLADLGIDLKGVRRASGPGDAFGAQLNSVQGGEMKPLTQTDEEEEQLHPRQAFPQTRTPPCEHTPHLVLHTPFSSGLQVIPRYLQRKVEMPPSSQTFLQHPGSVQG